MASIESIKQIGAVVFEDAMSIDVSPASHGSDPTGFRFFATNKDGAVIHSFSSATLDGIHAGVKKIFAEQVNHKLAQLNRGLSNMPFIDLTCEEVAKLRQALDDVVRIAQLRSDDAE